MIENKILSEVLNSFADEIRIKDSTYTNLRDRRNTVIGYIEKYIDDNHDIKIMDKFNVGSYKIKTGAKYQSEDFDIDYAVVFDVVDNPENFKNNLTSWLRDKLKEHYTYKVIVENNKKVITVRFMDKNDVQLFHLDIALYTESNGSIYHITRDSNGSYTSVHSAPKDTFNRQKEELREDNGTSYKRKAVRLLKYLSSRGQISGVSSLMITDYVIKLDNQFDTFTLIKKFLENASQESSFKLNEAPYSELIDDSYILNESATKFSNDVFKKETTKETYEQLNKKFGNVLPELSVDELNDNTERHFGG